MAEAIGHTMQLIFGLIGAAAVYAMVKVTIDDRREKRRWTEKDEAAARSAYHRARDQ